MPKRRLSDWIASYIHYIKDSSESPIEFHRWAAIGTVAGALQRRVYLRWGHSYIYPNQYIVLVGPSGTSRKGEPVEICGKMFKEVGLTVIGEDNTRESVIRDMRDAVTSFKNMTTNNVQYQCAASTFAEELSVFTGYQNAEWLATLTNWWDSRDEWKRGTKHQGRDELLGVCFNMVASTAPDWLPHILPREAVGGGFTSRVIFVVEPPSEKILDKPPMPSQSLRTALLHDLEAISSISGEFKLSKHAEEFYREWYKADRKLMLAGLHPVKHPMLSGYLGRRATHARKIAMALSAARSNSLVIQSADMVEATQYLERIEERMPIVFRGLGKAKFAEETEVILEMVKKRGKMRRSEIMRAMQSSLSAFDLDQVLRSLCTGNQVTMERIKNSEDSHVRFISGRVKVPGLQEVKKEAVLLRPLARPHRA